MTEKFPHELTAWIGLERDGRRENVEITVAAPNSLKIGGDPVAATNTATGRALVVAIRGGGVADLPRIAVGGRGGPGLELPVPSGPELPRGAYCVSLQIDRDRVLHTLLETRTGSGAPTWRLSHGKLPDGVVPVLRAVASPPLAEPPVAEPPVAEPPIVEPSEAAPPVAVAAATVSTIAPLPGLDPLLVKWGITDRDTARRARQCIEDYWEETVGRPNRVHGKPWKELDGKTRVDYFFLRPHEKPKSLFLDRHRAQERDDWDRHGQEIWRELKKRLAAEGVRRPATAKGALSEFRGVYRLLRELEGGPDAGRLTSRPFGDPGLASGHPPGNVQE